MAQDNRIATPKPGIASFQTESWGNNREPRFGDGIARTVTRTMRATADLNLPLYSVISYIAGVIALAALGAASGSATQTVTFSTAAAADADTVTINGRVYTFKTALTGAADEVLRGADFTASATNLQSAVNAGPGVGTTYGLGTVANAYALATRSAGVVTLIARDPGDEGNSLTLAKSGTNIAVGGATFAGGDDDVDQKPYGITACPVVMTNGQSMSVPVYVDGHWNMDALNWDSSYATDESKSRAFEGAVFPAILISKPKYNDDAIPV